MLTKSDLKQIQNVVKIEINPLKRDTDTLKKDVSQTRKDVKTLISYFDREYLELRKRIEKIEDHLNLTSKN